MGLIISISAWTFVSFHNLPSPIMHYSENSTFNAVEESNRTKRLMRGNYVIFGCFSFAGDYERRSLNPRVRFDFVKRCFWDEVARELKIRTNQLCIYQKDEIQDDGIKIHAHVHWVLEKYGLERYSNEEIVRICRKVWGKATKVDRASIERSIQPFDLTKKREGLSYVVKQSYKGESLLFYHDDSGMNRALNRRLKWLESRDQDRPLRASDCDLSGFDAAPPPPPIHFP